MSDKSFTFFEIHLHDGFEFSPTNTAPAIGVGDDEPEPAEEPEALDDVDESTSKGPSGRAIGGLVALVLLVAIAAVAKYLRGGDIEDLSDPDELSDMDDIEL